MRREDKNDDDSRITHWRISRILQPICIHLRNNRILQRTHRSGRNRSSFCWKFRKGDGIQIKSRFTECYMIYYATCSYLYKKTSTCAVLYIHALVYLCIVA